MAIFVALIVAEALDTAGGDEEHAAKRLKTADEEEGEADAGYEVLWPRELS